VVLPRYDKAGVVTMTSWVMILCSDKTLFSVMTPEGFPAASWNNISVYEEEGKVVAQVQSFERASDPIDESRFIVMGGTRRQEFIARLLGAFRLWVSFPGQPISGINIATCINVSNESAMIVLY
jgi:hypothetical protein